MSVHQKLAAIQQRLKAPKNQFNSFGKYNYRSCEDILEGIKPLLNEVGAVVVLNDSIELIGDRYYVKAKANLIDTENGDSVTVSAYAREDQDKKGMDLAQVTGSVSSYARKYALNGLFCIDDTKDSDATNKHDKDIKQPTPKKMTQQEALAPQEVNWASFWKSLDNLGYKKDDVLKIAGEDITKWPKRRVENLYKDLVARKAEEKAGG